MAALSMIGTAVAGWQARRASRDRMEFDTKTQNLEATVVAQGEKIKECEDDRGELRKSMEKCQDEHKTSREALDHEREARYKLEVRVASLERNT